MLRMVQGMVERQAPAALSAEDRRIINALQGGFPLTDTPYRDVADQLGMDEAHLLERLQALLDTRVLTRFGPMYQIERMGGRFVLAERMRESLNEVYRREHDFNRWFVLATETPGGIAAAIARIEQDTGLKVFAFPKDQEYFVELKLRA